MQSAEGDQVELGRHGGERDDTTPPRESSASENDHGSSNAASPVSSSPWNNMLGEEKQSPAGCPYRCIASMLKRDGSVLGLMLAGGLLYAGTDGKNIGVWSRPDLAEYSGLKSSSGGAKALAAAPSRAMIFSAHGDRRIRVWRRSRSNPTLHRRLATLPTLKDSLHNLSRRMQARHADAISCLAYDEGDGLLYSSSKDTTVKLWRISDFRCVETIEAHDEAVNAVAVARGGLVFTGSEDGTVKVWRRVHMGFRDCGHGRHLFEMTLRNVEYLSPVKALALAAGGSDVYAGCSDGSIKWWQWGDGQMHQPAGILRGHRNAVLCVAAVENLVFSGSADTAIRVWRRSSAADGAFHSCVAVLQGHRDGVESVAVSIDHHNGCLVYSGGLDGMLKVWWASTKPLP